MLHAMCVRSMAGQVVYVTAPPALADGSSGRMGEGHHLWGACVLEVHTHGPEAGRARWMCAGLRACSGGRPDTGAPLAGGCRNGSACGAVCRGRRRHMLRGAGIWGGATLAAQAPAREPGAPAGYLCGAHTVHAHGPRTVVRRRFGESGRHAKGLGMGFLSGGRGRVSCRPQLHSEAVAMSSPCETQHTCVSLGGATDPCRMLRRG